MKRKGVGHRGPGGRGELRDFFRNDQIQRVPWRGRRQRLSFVAGFYAAEYGASDRTFHSGPSDLTNAALLILLMEVVR